MSLPGRELLNVHWQYPRFADIPSETPVQFSQELVDALQASPEVFLLKVKTYQNAP